MPLDLQEAARSLSSGVITRMDAGQARMLGSDRKTDGWVNFVHAATIGLNAEFARLATDVAWRRHWGNLTYAAAAFEALLHMTPVPLKITFSAAAASEAEGADKPQEKVPSYSMRANAIELAVVNTPIFGGRMNLQFPLSHPRDQLLDFVIIDALDPAHMREVVERLVTMLEQNLPFGRSSEDEEPEPSELGVLAVGSDILPGVRQIQATYAQIETATPVDVTLDGEIGLQTPIEVRVAPDPLRVLLPQKEHDRLISERLFLPR